MSVTPIRLIYFATIVTICSLYAAQPIQPVFQREFELSSLQAILFTTLMMAPLGCAPLFYGYLLEAFSAKLLVRWSLALLGILEFMFALTNDYFTLLFLRAVQGLIIPAILTSLMSYISYSSAREDVQHSIAMYVGATIMGGFLGRFFSGLFTELFGWRVFFFVLGLLLLLASYLLSCLERDVKMAYARPRLADIAGLLRQGQFLWLYLAIFCLFFVFSALMNILPFELRKVGTLFGEAGVGLLYLGYSMGVIVSFNSRRIIRLFGSETTAISAGIVIFFIGTMIFMVERYSVMFLAMFVFCTGSFLAHSLLSGFVNKMAQDNKAIANGVYISFYYMGGTMGSFLPGYLFERFGWQVFLASLLCVLILALLFVHRLRHAVKTLA
ncbi:YNFM family putative membrane transporter [Desulfoprunum benzoelyticum]|uniref:YNFM family putative membrane transporter n=1 Tax=Desulfoprunum benzoelyticum TaxID=1506996 RepID=A0A840USC7_9BACT|nr:MFS transporter [Desulfoprunum benzoelyticum]MBB5349117.1 YNFM family putative membrane transporter [Desulfoprunum benzoelyticum]